MTTQEAREYFKSKGLSYKGINPECFEQLCNIVSEQLDVYRNSNDHAKKMDMKLSPVRKNDKKFYNGNLVRAKIQIDGSYFKRREGITFHESGFIGFCGELSTSNSEPILKAFVKWCDMLTEDIQE